MTKRIMIVAGEASGDLHGANLVNEARKLDPGLSFFGIGGPRMREAGVETMVDASQMAVVGLVEVIAHFNIISRAYLTLKKIIASDPPDLLILIDYLLERASLNCQNQMQLEAESELPAEPQAVQLCLELGTPTDWSDT